MALTKTDLKEIKNLLQENNKNLVTKDNLRENNKILLDYMDKTFATKKDIKRIEKKISFLPKKDEFYKKMNKWMKATSTKEIEETSHKSSHNRTRKRLSKIESHLGIVSAY